MRSMIHPLRDERGTSVVLVAVALTALMSMVALAVDVGMLLTARSEAQRAADAAALAGAGSLIVQPNDGARARQIAIEYGGLNQVQSQDVEVLPEDVLVDLAQQRVTVTVRRADDRGNPIGTWFARVFGVDAVDVAARAVARVQPAGSAVCVKPWTIFDRFLDVDGDDVLEPGDGDQYDPFVHGYGTEWMNGDGTGYVNDFGRPIVLKGGGPGAAGGQGKSKGAGQGPDCCPGTGPSWYYAWDIPQTQAGVCAGGWGGQGANCYRWAIENCHPGIISVGEEYMVANGAMTGPTVQGVQGLIAKDPGATWDPAQKTVVGSAYNPWEASPRVGIVPTFDPARPFDPGKQPIEFTNFLAVFIEDVQGAGTAQTVHGRILFATGVGGGGPTSSGAKFVQLVE